MRTTLSLDDDLMRVVKRRPAEAGRTVSSMIETALRELLRQEDRTDRTYRLLWVTVPGGVQPGVDLTDRDRDKLLDRMEEPSRGIGPIRFLS